MSERVRLAAQSLQDEHGGASVSAVLTRFGGTPFYIAPEVSRLEGHRQSAECALLCFPCYQLVCCVLSHVKSDVSDCAFIHIMDHIGTLDANSA
jgi:uncharacterized protein (DUF1330 family)